MIPEMCASTSDEGGAGVGWLSEISPVARPPGPSPAGEDIWAVLLATELNENQEWA
jgi:hypothetical protein